MYPFAIAYKLTGKAQYRDVAIKLGNWLITIQETSGKRTAGWSENWPDPGQKGWYATTTDQLISMAGAYITSFCTVSDAPQTLKISLGKR